MKSINSVTRILVATAAFGLSATGVSAAKLSEPIVASAEERSAKGVSAPGFAEYQARTQFVQQESWRQRALEAVAKQPDAFTPDSDFRLVAESVHSKPAGRVLAEEFLAELSDERIGKLASAAQTDRSTAISMAQTRLIVAEEVLGRPGLSVDHAKAAHERASMVLLLGLDLKEAIAAFENVKAVAGPNSEYAEKGRAAIAALTNPEATSDYSAALELLATADQYWSARATGFVATRILNQMDKNGPEHFSPARFGGDTAPLRAATRVAFEIDRAEQLMQLLAIAEKSSLSAAELVEIRYWVGMSEYSNKNYAEGIAIFEKNLASGVRSKLVAESCHEAGQCAMLKYDFTMAAVYFFEVTENHRQHRETVTKSQQAFDALLESGRLDQAAFQTALTNYRKSQQLALNTRQTGN